MVSWTDFREKKPTKEGEYLVESGWHPDVSIVDVAYWNRKKKKFMTWDHYHDEEAVVTGVRYWSEINKPGK